MGYLLYTLHRCSEIPGQYLVYERWASPEAMDAHLKTPHVRALLSKLDSLLVEPAEIATYTVLAGGLPEKTLMV